MRRAGQGIWQLRGSIVVVKPEGKAAHGSLQRGKE